ncbi:MAG: hypothetical protein IPF66_04045 [Holophagales bacterium]|nr:hypothetical protein [Holophagales bacterium]
MGGALRAATADAGVLVRAGSAWSADRSGLLPRGAQAFLDLGADLVLGTAGGGLYRRQGSGWTPLVGPHPAAVVTDIVPPVAPEGFATQAVATSSGSGATFVNLPQEGLRASRRRSPGSPTAAGRRQPSREPRESSPSCSSPRAAARTSFRCPPPRRSRPASLP